MTHHLSDTLEHLRTHYLTMDELEMWTGIPSTRVCELIEAGCVPPHSHELEAEVALTTSLWGRRPQKVALRYYPRSLVEWILQAEALASRMSLEAAAAEVRERFFAELRIAIEAVRGARDDSPECFDANGDLIESELVAWQEVRLGYLMDGTFGICLKDISATNIVRKLVAVSVLTKYLAASEGVRQGEVEHALREYDAVAALFLPSERPGSTRVRVFEAARAKFLAACGTPLAA